MADPAKLTIRADFPRPGAEDLAPFLEAPTGWVADAYGRRGALCHRIRPISEIAHFVGTALTVQSRPVDNLAPYAALKFARPGDVLMIATGACETTAVLGDILLGMARNAGIVAVVTDGLVRDVAGIREVGLPTFAVGLTPNSPFKDGPGSVGLAIALGGVTVDPGDIVVGDADGVVVVPRRESRAVAAALAEVATKEQTMDAAVAGGASYPAWLDEILASARISYLE